MTPEIVIGGLLGYLAVAVIAGLGWGRWLRSQRGSDED
jgi:hypothetical protein